MASFQMADNGMPPLPSTAAVNGNVYVNVSINTPKKQPKAIHAILEWGYANGRESGWRAKDLGVDGEKGADRIKPSARYQSLLCQDVRELNGYLAAKPEVNHHNERHAEINKFVARENNEVNPITFSYLSKAWGVRKNYPLLVLKRQAKLGKPKPDPVPNLTQISVIESLEAAKIRFTAKSLFIDN